MAQKPEKMDRKPIFGHCSCFWAVPPNFPSETRIHCLVCFFLPEIDFHPGTQLATVWLASGQPQCSVSIGPFALAVTCPAVCTLEIRSESLLSCVPLVWWLLADGAEQFPLLSCFSSSSLLLPFPHFFSLSRFLSLSLPLSLLLSVSLSLSSIYIYIYAVKLKTGPDFPFYKLKTGPSFCVFLLLFSKISLSLQKEEDF